MKVLLLCTGSKANFIFRHKLMELLLNEGYQVFIHCLDNKYQSHFEKMGVTFYSYLSSNRSISIFKTLGYKKHVASICKNISPDLVLTFQAKPNTFGVLGASKYVKKENIVSMVEGSGDVFYKNTIKWLLIRMIVCATFKKAFKRVKYVFFLNRDNINLFIKKRLLKVKQVRYIPGIGLDLNKFSQTNVLCNKCVGMASRLVEDKGIIEYCVLARYARQIDPSIKFFLAGQEGTVKVKHIQKYIDEGDIIYLNDIEDMIDFYNSIDIYVSTSYHEGFPVTIMEAMSSGRVPFASNTVGNRDAVVSSEYGILFDLFDLSFVASEIVALINDKEKLICMSNNARKYAEKHFDDTTIQNQYLDIVLERETKNEFEKQ